MRRKLLRNLILFMSRLEKIDINEEIQKENDYLREENKALLAMVQKRHNRLSLTADTRKILAEKAMALGKRMADVVNIVKPDTILRWHRKLIACKQVGIQRKTGRPKTKIDVVTLILKMAQENNTWGYTRIVGELKKLGIKVSRSNVANILHQHNIHPSPNLTKSELTWAEFINRHKNVIWATDFFTAEVWTMSGLVTYYVLFFINLGSRKVTIAGITDRPVANWVEQHARNLTGFDGVLAEAKFLIHDRDTKYTKKFDAILQGAGVNPIKLPICSPNLNAYAERFVLSIKTECIDQFIPIGYKSLVRAIKCYEKYYNTQRPHQGLDNNLLTPPLEIITDGEVKCEEHLGGILKHYYRQVS